MAVTIGEGQYKYRVDLDWAKIPEGWELNDVASVAIDAKDNVFLFTRGEHPVIVLDRQGNFLRSWGEGLFKHAHGIHIGADGYVYCTDDGDHTVRKCTPEGKVVLTIGTPNKPSAYMSGLPFNRCTHTALSPQGDIYVSDGYGNGCVHKYTPDGRLVKTWGRAGTEPGEFNISHCICCDRAGWVYVADRENHRVQVFNGDGRYETQWNNMHRPNGLYMVPSDQPLFYIGELGPRMPVNRNMPGIGPRMSIYTDKGLRVARFGDNGTGLKPEQFISPHGIAVDSHGDIYVGEVSYTAWAEAFPGQPRPKPLRSLRKLVKVPA